MKRNSKSNRRNDATAPAANSEPRRNAAADKLAEIFIAALEKGVAPWRKEWASGICQDAPCNIDGKRYRGINRLYLSWMLSEHAFRTPFFLTFSRVKSLGGSVKKGEHGFPVVFWKSWDKKVEEEDENGEAVIKVKKVGVWRYYYVFHLSQCDIPADALPARVRSYVPAPMPAPLVVPAEVEAAGEAIWNAYPNPPKRLPEKGGEACYIPQLDSIQLPPRANFRTAEAYYSTLFHEMTHSTGHESRLNRLSRVAAFGSEKYGREELVAEMGAAMLCQRAGFLAATQDNSAAYLASWIKTIREQPSIILSAASAAQKAVEWICGEEEGEAADAAEAEGVAMA